LVKHNVVVIRAVRLATAVTLFAASAVAAKAAAVYACLIARISFAAAARHFFVFYLARNLYIFYLIRDFFVFYAAIVAAHAVFLYLVDLFAFSFAANLWAAVIRFFYAAAIAVIAVKVIIGAAAVTPIIKKSKHNP
jgi:hypothetical protein